VLGLVLADSFPAQDMDPSHDPVQDWVDSRSHYGRSRTSSSVTAAEGHFRHLRLDEAPAPLPSPGSSRPHSARGPLSPTYISILPPPSATYSSQDRTPSSSSPLLGVSSALDVDAGWFETADPLTYSHSPSASLLRTREPQDSHHLPIAPSSLPIPGTPSAAMG
jgi:hypothetical protein